MNRELLKQVLDALKLAVLRSEKIIDKEYDAAITALEAELAKPDQKAELDQALIALRIKEEEHKCCAEDLLRWRKSAESAIQENVELRAELATPDHEPVGYVYWNKGHAEGALDNQNLKPGTPLYAAPTEPTSQTRNCSHNPDAPHGPDGAGGKCHSWAPGEAS